MRGFESKKDSDLHNAFIGRVATVVRGRNVAVGTTGKVAWTGFDRFGKARVGIKLASGDVVFTARANCEFGEPTSENRAHSEYVRRGY